MKTECNVSQLEFQGLGRRKVVADFEGGHLSSDGGALLLREVDESGEYVSRFSDCFTDHRNPELVDHELVSLLRQRVFGLALGYEDLNDFKDLSRDPLLALAVGREDILGEERRCDTDKGKVLASASTLNRLELTPADADSSSRYQKIVYHPEAIEELLVDFFLDSYEKAPEEIVLDFDATDDPLHGSQEGRFFHGYYKCYCYMPLYVTCGDHLLVSKLRMSDRDASDGALDVLAWLVARIRERWPDVHIILRADSGFCRNPIMSWCERKGVYYLVGLAKNSRLNEIIADDMTKAKIRARLTGRAARVFSSFQYQTRESWSHKRRVIGKAEYLLKGSNHRFVVTNLPEDYAEPDQLYERVYCARGDMENRIKEQQLDLFADRTSSHTMRANQLRLWFSSMAYVLVSALRRHALKGTQAAKATCGTIRLKLLKIGALVKVSCRRVLVQFPDAYPYKELFEHALHYTRHYPLRT